MSLACSKGGISCSVAGASETDVSASVPGLLWMNKTNLSFKAGPSRIGNTEFAVSYCLWASVSSVSSSPLSHLCLLSPHNQRKRLLRKLDLSQRGGRRGNAGAWERKFPLSHSLKKTCHAVYLKLVTILRLLIKFAYRICFTNFVFTYSFGLVII